MQKKLSFRFETKKQLSIFCTAIVVSVFIISLILTFFVPKVIKSSTTPEGVFVPIIMYHSVCDDEKMFNDYVIPTIQLEKDIVYLKHKGYTPIFVEDLINYVHIGSELPEKPVIISFDDGFYNFYQNVLPLLEEYDFKATLSVVGSYAEASDNHSDHSENYSYLTSEEITEIYNSCRVEIANHTYDLHNLDDRQGCKIKKGESYEDYRSVFLSDLLKAESYLEDNCSIATRVFTYPYGSVCEPSFRIIKSAGYLASLGVEERPNYITKDPECLYNLYRYNRPYGISTEDFFERALSQ